MATARASTIANVPRFCDSRQGMKNLEDDLTSAEALAAPLHEIERMMRAQGRELMRTMMQAHLDARTAQERPVSVRGADGVERVQTRQGTRTLMTEYGEVVLERTLYQAPGVDALARSMPRWAWPRRSTRTRCAGSSPRRVRARRSTRWSSS
jgi:hypothetical protein